MVVVVSDDRDYHNLKPCGNFLPLAILLTLFYALPRYAYDCWRGRP